MARLKEIMRIFNKRAIADDIGLYNSRVYNFVAGDIDQLTYEQVKQVSDIINEKAKLACIELESIATEKRRDAENKVTKP